MKYTKLVIKSCDGGWTIEESNNPTKVFVRWAAVIHYLEDKLTSKGDKSKPLPE